MGSSEHDSDNSYCESCAEIVDEENQTETLEDLSSSPRVKEYGFEPEWNFVKQPWENTRYLGIELECAGSYSVVNKLLNIAPRYLKNQHCWKEDSSIGGGAELVTTPMTLQSLHKVDFKKMLKEFSDSGALSYDAETCGLHVHVSNQLSTFQVKKLRAFFSAHRNFFKTFSKRDWSQLDQWARIPERIEDWTNARYQAINVTGPTIEFRLYRGTLDYKRFKASVLMSDALCEAMKHIGLSALMSRHGINHFYDWIATRGEYHFLARYLRNNHLSVTTKKGA